MKKIIKLWLLYMLIISCCSFTTHASFSDCEYIASQKFTQSWNINQFPVISQVWWTSKHNYSNFLDVDIQLAIIDTWSLNSAILNLKKYCCEKWLWWLSMDAETCKIDKKFFNDNALDSPYLFDHLFDVEMRRLYGDTWENKIYTKTNMWIDSFWELNWSERRTRIDGKSMDLSWANAQEIINKYKKFWTQNKEYNIVSKVEAAFTKSNKDFLKYVSWQWSSTNSWESIDIANALKNYEKRSLYDRYNNACAITEYLYALLTQWIAQNNITDQNSIIQILSLNTCKTATRNFINNETAYTKYVLQTLLVLFNNVCN